MALNDNMPTVVGGGNIAIDGAFPQTTKVEVLGLSGWTYEQDHPKSLRLAGCVSLGHGLVTIGGGNLNADSDYKIVDEVYLLRDHTWSFAGVLNQVFTICFLKIYHFINLRSLS